MNEEHPVRFSVDYPDRPLDRLTTALRIFTVIPIAIVLASIGGYASGGGYDEAGDAPTIVIGGAGLLFLPPLLMILFREKYPRWWFDWNLELLRFTNRVGHLPRADGRPLPLDRRAAVGAARLPLPRRQTRPQPLAAAGQMAARDPALHRAAVPLPGG